MYTYLLIEATQNCENVNIPYRWTVGVIDDIIYKNMMYQVYHLQR